MTKFISTVVPNLYYGNAVGAVLNSDTSTASMSFVVDEDNMASDSATKTPTQQSVKAYVDTTVIGLFEDKGNYNASTNSPDLDVSPSGVKKGDTYLVSVAGTFFTEEVAVGDAIRALQDNPTALAHWARTETNLVDAIVDADFSVAEGFMRKTSAGNYTALKSNLGATTTPTLTDDTAAGYTVGSIWIDTTLDLSYTCVDATNGAAKWTRGAHGLKAVYVAANYNLSRFEQVVVDTSLGAYTMTLPNTNLFDGFVITVGDYGNNAFTNNITVARNGNTIDGAAADLVINRNNGSANFYWNVAANTWKTIRNPQRGLSTSRFTTLGVSSTSTPAQCAAATTTTPTAANSSITYNAFDGTNDESGFITTSMSRRWDLGQVRFKIYFCVATNATGNVKWDITACTQGAGDLMNVAFPAVVSVTTAAAGVAYQKVATAWTSWFTVGGTHAEFDTMNIKIIRNAADGTDTLNGVDALYLHMDMEWWSLGGSDN